jgi:predicted benzoate:H+ symporter BenE
MKTPLTIVLSLIAIVASLALVLSTVCTFNRGLINGEKRLAYVICAVVSLSVVIAAMWAIGKLNKKT